MSVIKWKSALSNAIYEVLKDRPGWEEAKDDDDWDFYWLFRDRLDANYRLKPWQKVNRFPKDSELADKAKLAYNIKIYKKKLEEDGDLRELKKFEFVPNTFVLPDEYNAFLEDFHTYPDGTLWIAKPVGGRGGQDMNIFKDLQGVENICRKTSIIDINNNDNYQKYVAQNYISEPYLIDGRKFDIRIYVLVTSFNPLKAYLHRDGCARFCGLTYDSDDINNLYAHITNVSYQVQLPTYDVEDLMWSIQQLRCRLVHDEGRDKVDTLFERMSDIFVYSLRAVQRLIGEETPNFFQLFGFDVIVDSDLKPWLLEVNARPSLTGTGAYSRGLKCRVVADLLDVLDLEGRRRAAATTDAAEDRIGGFDLFWHRGGPVYDDCRSAKRKINTHLGCETPR